MQKFNFILGAASVTVFVDGNSYTVNKQAKTYPLLIDAIRSNDIVAVRNAVNIRKSIVESLGSNLVRIDGDAIVYGDREVTGLISGRIFEMLRIGLDVKPMVKFIERMMKNPSRRAVQELFGFMEACSLPITEDGYFLAYKRVRGDYTSVHDAKTDNSIGTIVQMERNMVDEDANRTCSYGLHFCSYDYLKHFSGERIVVLKIDPQDVVAIPADYNNSKGRACKYEVVGEIPLNEYSQPAYTLDEHYTQSFRDDEPEAEKVSDVVTEDLDTVLSPSGMTLRKLRGIRAALLDGQTYASIAAEFKISPRQVGRIDRQETWANLT